MKTISATDDQQDHRRGRQSASAGLLRGRVVKGKQRTLFDPAAGSSTSTNEPAADRLAIFTPVITAVRLSTTALSVLLATSKVLNGDHVVAACTVILIAFATFRSVRPLRYTAGLASLGWTLLEVVVATGVVVATDFWSSPFVFVVLTPVVIAGFARGFAFGLRITTVCAAAISVPAVYLSNDSTDTLRLSGTWGALLVVIALVSGNGRKLSGAADRERDITLDRLGRLADANALLYSLHRVAQTLPSSLDMNDVLTSTVLRIRELIDFDSVVILLFDDTDGHWQVIRQEGCHLGARLGVADLPRGLRQALAESTIVTCNRLGVADGSGFDDRSGSGLYGALTARGAVMGLIALEHRDANKFDHRASGLLSGLVPPLAMALDNARWFARLRTVGADEERTRIARDLHDRIGQSLAYLAFELDRIVNRHKAGDELGNSLDHLRDDVRGVIREVRDTLYDLRTDVTDSSGLHEILEQYADRVSDRTALEFEIEADDAERLPLLQEREMWRIAQEAITNIERHAKASHVRVTWRCSDGRAAIRISDDGIGFETGRSGRLDSYGMLGMRERASSIGATLEVHSMPGQGTSITCVLDPSFPVNHPEEPLKPGARK